MTPTRLSNYVNNLILGHKSCQLGHGLVTLKLEAVVAPPAVNRVAGNAAKRVGLFLS